MLRRPATLALTLPLLVAGALAAPSGATTTHSEARQRATSQVALTSWSSYADFKAGQRTGLKLGRGQVSLLDPRPRTPTYASGRRRGWR